MKKKKLKLKKGVWVCLAVVLFSIIGIYAGIKIHEQKEYQKTNEYKLLNVGYNLEDIKLLEENLNDEQLKDLFNEKNDLVLNILKEKYFLKRNLDKYLSYAKVNANLSAKEIVTIINTNRNNDYYTDIKETDTSKDYLLLVNKYHSINKDYTPLDLVNINIKYYYGNNHKTRKVTYDAFKAMWNAAYNEGIYLIINSSYRTFESQENTYNEIKNNSGTDTADRQAARPGHSEHQTGLALDIFSKDNTSSSTFENSNAYAWLKENAYKYGFIERYPKDFVNITGFQPESWHWRYVGVEAATYIHENNITFDEYYAYFIEK